MNNDLMISVITPVYNGEHFIESCIKVVVDQKCLNVEHIIVDGGSSDLTVEIVKQYAEQYPHIRWISEADQGQSDAMNKGVKMSRGDIIGMLNVDDFYEPDVLVRILEIFQMLPDPSLLVGNCNLLDEHDQIKYINKPSDLRFIKLLTQQCEFPINPSAYFYHKSIHHKIGDYPINEHYMMDLDFILKAVQNSNTKYMNELWGNHRQIEGTKTVSLLNSGHHREHLLNLLLKHRQNLSIYLRTLAMIEADIIPRFGFVVDCLNRLSPSLAKKIRKWRYEID